LQGNILAVRGNGIFILNGINPVVAWPAIYGIELNVAVRTGVEVPDVVISSAGVDGVLTPEGVDVVVRIVTPDGVVPFTVEYPLDDVAVPVDGVCAATSQTIEVPGGIHSHLGP
jgi:hypothetical protein